jgi:hypothetical protein
VTAREVTGNCATKTILQATTGTSFSDIGCRCKQRQGGKTYCQNSHATKLRSGRKNVNELSQVPVALCAECLTV